MKETELKPCPFCGGNGYISPVATKSGTYFGATFEVGCKKCKFSFKEESIWHIVNGQIVTTQDGYNDCVKKWNRRLPMEKQKQIEEIKDWIDSMYGCDCAYYGVDGLMIAEGLYNAGYRKQSEGEWVDADICAEDMYCSVCGGIAPVDCEKEEFYKSNFCPNCGANMKGE